VKALSECHLRDFPEFVSPKSKPNYFEPARHDKYAPGVRGKTMAESKVVFVAFAIEDVRIRDLIKGQSLHTDSPFEYVDMSVKEAYDEEWKKRVRTRILRSDGVLAIISKNSLTSAGQKWEIQCAREEKRRCGGFWAYNEDRTNVIGVDTVVWTWANIAAFINSL
jgi:hypothetical protein